MNTNRVERVYSVYSGFYDHIFGKIFHKSRLTAIDLLEISPGERVLEIGIGTGLSLPLYPNHCEITGIDISGPMLEKGLRRVQKQNILNITLKKMDATRMDFPDNTFDSVFAAYVISTVPKPKEVVKEMIRVCKDQGRIVFLNHFKNGNRWISIFEKGISPICERIGFRTDLELSGILQDTPLVVNQKKKLHPFHFWKVVQCYNQKENKPESERKHPIPSHLQEQIDGAADSESIEISREYSSDLV